MRPQGIACAAGSICFLTFTQKPVPGMQAGQLATALKAAQSEAAALEEHVQKLKKELASAHMTRAADIQSYVEMLQVGCSSCWHGAVVLRVVALSLVKLGMYLAV